MNKNYFLAYLYTNREGMTDGDHSWFETKEKLNEFINDCRNDKWLEDFEIIEIIKINSYEILYNRDNEPCAE